MSSLDSNSNFPDEETEYPKQSAYTKQSLLSAGDKETS
jgi:hypothetical protein